VPIGGLGEIGKNMLVFEYADAILVVDSGLMFPEEEMPGVDIVIPDTTYLKDKPFTRASLAPFDKAELMQNMGFQIEKVL